VQRPDRSQKKGKRMALAMSTFEFVVQFVKKM
jgi:hypothetical protein